MSISIRSFGLTRKSNSIRSVVQRFQASRASSRISLEEYWRQQVGDRSITLLSALIKEDLHLRFEAGERPTASEYFARFPELVADDDRALSLVYEEFCLLEDHQANPSVGEFCRRYAQWQDSLISQLGYHQGFSQVVATSRPQVNYPAVGDRFATYQLSSLLGTGGTAQVYLATDDLGGRQVVLKVSSSVGQEPAILAQLEHRHIVPILTMAESPESGLRGICMPYRPGITLETVLRGCSAGIMPKRARFLIDSFAANQTEIENEESGWRDFPSSGTYTEGVAWVGVAMAKALVYLHSKDIFHRDIKPANILLAYKEGPLLFDFNLAHSPSDPIQAQAAMKGGTLPYMAPEQLRAFIDPRCWDSVAAPADIYAFGLVLREMVTGLKPDRPRSDLQLDHAIKDLLDRRLEPVASTRLTQPEIPPSLDAIILKCLATRPADRYLNASQLCVDLQRYLKRQPLAFAVSLSRVEVLVNWTYRRRKLIALLGLLIGIALSVNWGYKPGLTTAMVQEGAVLLNSSAPGQWRLAIDHYQRLVRDYPDDASPLVCLGLAYHRLGMVELGKKVFRDAYGKHNLEAAIQLGLQTDGLQTDATLIPLKLSLGEFYLTVRNDYQLARHWVGEVLKADAEHYGAWELLGAIEHELDNEQSIRSYQKAIEFAQKEDNLVEANRIRRFLTPALLEALEAKLQGSPTPRQLAQAQDYLALVGEQIRFLGVKQSQEGPSEDFDLDLTLTYTRGVQLSGSAFIRNRRGELDSEATAREFRQARTIFQEVLQSTQAALKSYDLSRRILAAGLQNYSLNQLEELDRRADVCQLDQELVPRRPAVSPP